MKGYRRIKPYTYDQAAKRASSLNQQNLQSGMLGSIYFVEEYYEGDSPLLGYMVTHYCLSSPTSYEVYNGFLPYDYEEGYREGYIKNVQVHQTR